MPHYLRWLICVNVGATGLLCIVWFGGCASGAFKGGTYCAGGPNAPLGLMASLLTSITGLAVNPAASRREDYAPPEAPPAPPAPAGSPPLPPADPFGSIPGSGGVLPPD